MLFPFLLSLLATLFCSIFFPNLHLLTFSPFLALFCMRNSFLNALWIAVLSGLILDLLSSSIGFGLNALAYTIATVFLYKQKRHFFVDQPLALSVYTVLFSSTISCILYIFQNIPFSLSIVISEFILMPILDGIYAFLWFTCPIKLYHYGKKVGWRYLLGR